MAELEPDYYQPYVAPPKKNRYLLHIGLFLFTIITTIYAGMQWRSGTGLFTLEDIYSGIPYSICVMFIITFHEFGHYFAAKAHKVDATLPFYIPFPPIPIFINFGTMGAVIRTRTPVMTKKAMFDIGIAGPLAGFVACIAVLIYGFTHLPGREFILSIHPDYFAPKQGSGGIDMVFGNTILFSFLKSVFVSPSQFFPPMNEIYHYPYLCAGWFGLLITSMNMLPVGQLDGGHIGYTMFGEKKHSAIAAVSLIIIFLLGILGFLEMNFDFYTGIGWFGWLPWAAVLYFIVKFKHPPIYDDSKLNTFRMFLGFVSYFILIISFTPAPIEVFGV